MHPMIKTILHTAAGAVPLAAYRMIIKKRLTAFCYHLVSDENLPHVRYYDYKGPAEFEQDIVYLKKNFDLVSYDAFISLASTPDAVKKNTALITFDDGLSQCFTSARTILLKHRLPCVFFIATGYMDNTHLLPEQKASLCLTALERTHEEHSRPLLDKLSRCAKRPFPDKISALGYLKNFASLNEETIDCVCGILAINAGDFLGKTQPFLSSAQIRQLAAEGFTIGAHSCSHRRLDLIPARETYREIIVSCRTIMTLTGARHLPFAFPHHGRFIDRRMLERLIKENPFIDVMFDGRGFRDDIPFVFNRVWADAGGPRSSGRSNIPRILRRAYADYLRSRLDSRQAPA